MIISLSRQPSSKRMFVEICSY
uniref:Uncharacterized protein n=1 Tax=Arundo donax TaxID=35708 RepID=A0A0A9BEQ4_ARUDO